MMRKLGICLVPAVLCLAMFVGCSEENLHPYFTRISVDNNCGVAPLTVEFFGIVSGGNQLDEPTGANLYLDVTWDFGDGDTATGSLVRHTFTEAGACTVLVTVEDADGDAARDTVFIDVKQDSLTIWVTATGDRDPSTPDIIDIYDTDAAHATCFADMCGFNGDYSRFAIRWYPDAIDPDRENFIYEGLRQIRIGFMSEGPGDYRFIPSMEDVANGRVRRDTVDFRVTPCPDGGPPNTLDIIASASLDNDPETPVHDVERLDVFDLSFEADICGFEDEYYRFNVSWFVNRITNSPFSRNRETEFTFSDFPSLANGPHTLIARVYDAPLAITRYDTLYFELTTP